MQNPKEQDFNADQFALGIQLNGDVRHKLYTARLTLVGTGYIDVQHILFFKISHLCLTHW